MILAKILAAVVAAALLNRVRGGLLSEMGWNVGSTVQRVIYALGLSAITFWLPANVMAVPTAPLFFAGVAVFGWGSWMDLKRSPDVFNESLDPIFKKTIGRLWPQGSYGYEFAALSLRGSLVTLPAGAALIVAFGSSGALYAASGLAMGVVYEAAWRIAERTRKTAHVLSIAESLFGAWCGGALAASLVL